MHLFGSPGLDRCVVGFVVGIVVGLTGMGGGALMTPALIFLGVGRVHGRHRRPDGRRASTSPAARPCTGATGQPNIRLARLADRRLGADRLRSAPHRALGRRRHSEDARQLLKLCIGFALLLAASTYALRLYIQLRHVQSDRRGRPPSDPAIRPLPTFLVGALGGLLVGITSRRARAR